LATAEAEYLWPGLNHIVGVCGVAPASVGVGGTNTTTQAVQTFKVGFNYLLAASIHQRAGVGG